MEMCYLYRRTRLAAAVVPLHAVAKVVGCHTMPHFRLSGTPLALRYSHTCVAESPPTGYSFTQYG